MISPRYHPLQVALHWVSAVLVIGAWTVGAIVLERIPESEAGRKVVVLGAHMIAGLTIAFVMTLRLALRFTFEQPAPATSGNALLDRLAKLVHWALYVAALAMAGSGLALALQAGLPAILLSGGTVPPHEELGRHAALGVHAVIGTILISLVFLHALAALWHQFVRKDGLMRRMGFGRVT